MLPQTLSSPPAWGPPHHLPPDLVPILQALTHMLLHKGLQAALSALSLRWTKGGIWQGLCKHLPQERVGVEEDAGPARARLVPG